LLIVEFIVQIINVFLLLVTLDSRATFVPLVSSLALRATLVPFLALILIAGTADREGALIAGDKNVTGGRNANRVATNLADLAIHALHWLSRGGGVAVVADHDELVAVVRARHHPLVRRHLCAPSALHAFNSDDGDRSARAGL
jgi:hypothetical protein